MNIYNNYRKNQVVKIYKLLKGNLSMKLKFQVLKFKNFNKQKNQNSVQEEKILINLSQNI